MYASRRVDSGMLPVWCELDRLVRVLLLDGDRQLALVLLHDDCAIVTQLIGLYVVDVDVDVD